MPAKMPGQGVEINIFGRLGGLDRVGPLPASPPSLSHAKPMARPITSPAKSPSLDKTLQQIDRMPVLVLPILTQPPGHLAQKVAGQAGDSDPRQDQIATVVGQIMKSGGPLRLIPTDKLIPCPAATRPRQKADTPHPGLACPAPDISYSGRPPATPDNDTAANKHQSAWPRACPPAAGSIAKTPVPPTGSEIGSAGQLIGATPAGLGRGWLLCNCRAGKTSQPRAASFSSKARAAKSLIRPRPLRQSHSWQSSRDKRLRLHCG